MFSPPPSLKKEQRKRRRDSLSRTSYHRQIKRIYLREQEKKNEKGLFGTEIALRIEDRKKENEENEPKNFRVVSSKTKKAHACIYLSLRCMYTCHHQCHTERTRNRTYMHIHKLPYHLHVATPYKRFIESSPLTCLASNESCVCFYTTEKTCMLLKLSRRINREIHTDRSICTCLYVRTYTGT